MTLRYLSLFSGIEAASHAWHPLGWECERLQGFADDHTLIPGTADGPRYKALGNSMAVPVMAWIGRQIDFVWRFW